jgi:hypothetical protein
MERTYFWIILEFPGVRVSMDFPKLQAFRCIARLFRAIGRRLLGHLSGVATSAARKGEIHIRSSSQFQLLEAWPHASIVNAAIYTLF